MLNVKNGLAIKKITVFTKLIITEGLKGVETKPCPLRYLLVTSLNKYVNSNIK